MAQECSDYVTYPVLWSTRQDDENPKQYFDRIYTQAQGLELPLAWRSGGSSSVGIRYTNGTSPPSGPSAWRISGSPKWWRAQEIQDTLAAQNWSDIAILYPPKRNLPWLIKAKPPPDMKHNVWALEVGEHTLTIAKQPPRIPKVSNITPQQTGNWWRQTHQEQQDAQTPLEVGDA